MNAPTTLEDLARIIGNGFHPDTTGSEYSSLPAGITPQLVDSIVDEAHQAFEDGEARDPNKRALRALRAEEILSQYSVRLESIEAALRNDGSTLEDYETTIFGLINDGTGWRISEDSMGLDEAVNWALDTAAYGEHVGLYRWEGN